MLKAIDRGFVYWDPANSTHGVLTDARLSSSSDRLRLELCPPKLTDGDLPPDRWQSTEVEGVVISLAEGIPYLPHVRWANQLLKEGKTVWFYWPREAAVERIDRERLASFRRHRWALKGLTAFDATQRTFRRARGFVVLGVVRSARALGRLGRKMSRVRHLPARVLQADPPGGSPASPEPDPEPSPEEAASDTTSPVTRETELLGTAAAHDLKETLDHVQRVSVPAAADAGRGLYLRTDFWAPITSGGSYGHTCYVAKYLARRSEAFLCLMPSRYSLLDDMQIPQFVMTAPFHEWPEDHIRIATAPLFSALLELVRFHQPSYIYERLCLGNYLGAKLSQALNIPYLVEYNGSEISMRKSFEGRGYDYEEFYLEAEEAAFRQASLISVISQPVKQDLVARGVDAEKILVNPNGADPDVFAPRPAEEQASLKQELGWPTSSVVLGFTGTFGGWHGIEILAEALPEVTNRYPQARFLLIGDGNYKHLVDDQIVRYGLERVVHCSGRVAQEEGRRLLGACDIFLSPHSSHMKDQRFFGSPTKLFEYMAMGKGIVASRLEQLGDILSPGLDAKDLEGVKQVSEENAVLCEPGSTRDFVEGISFLIEHPELRARLGRNARARIVQTLSWERHVDRLWRAAYGEDVDQLEIEALGISAQPKVSKQYQAPLEVDDEYKRETQAQWDRDACGSHYVEEAEPTTLEWYLEVEKYRYETYAPWMPETMEFASHAGEEVLEIGAGIGTDLCQFARNGAKVTDVDLSSGHLEHARRNFALRGLEGNFIHHDAETLPFDDDQFDLVYSNGVIHHTPNTQAVVDEIFRVLKPGGRTILMVYAENSLHYWRNLFFDIGVKENALSKQSMSEIMSRSVEISEAGSRPLVKVYSRRRLRSLLARFDQIEIVQRQMLPTERPKLLRWVSSDLLQRYCGWNLIVKAEKPAR